MFFSHNKSTNNIFQPAYQHSRTGPMLPEKLNNYFNFLVALCLASEEYFTAPLKQRNEQKQYDSAK
jgi:hypothetical protein